MRSKFHWKGAFFYSEWSHSLVTQSFLTWELSCVKLTLPESPLHNCTREKMQQMCKSSAHRHNSGKTTTWRSVPAAFHHFICFKMIQMQFYNVSSMRMLLYKGTVMGKRIAGWIFHVWRSGPEQILTGAPDIVNIWSLCPVAGTIAKVTLLLNIAVTLFPPKREKRLFHFRVFNNFHIFSPIQMFEMGKFWFKR